MPYRKLFNNTRNDGNHRNHRKKKKMVPKSDTAKNIRFVLPTMTKGGRTAALSLPNGFRTVRFQISVY